MSDSVFVLYTTGIGHFWDQVMTAVIDNGGNAAYGLIYHFVWMEASGAWMQRHDRFILFFF